MKTALVIDDYYANRILAARLLTKAGWAVVQAASGADGLDWLRTNQAALVLLDISMPALSGVEVCRAIRKENLGGSDLKVVAYTAHAMNNEIAEFLATGFDAVLVKPVSREAVAEMLAAAGF
ncbi:MAG: response regulator [Alphaproteobacteria bacterium]|nr:response regulator [Alphaproteobacteria bacterium]